MNDNVEDIPPILRKLKKKKNCYLLQPQLIIFFYKLKLCVSNLTFILELVPSRYM